MQAMEASGSGGTPAETAAAAVAAAPLLESCNLRAAFVAPPGCVLLAADYCQIELRMMAHLSGDEKLHAALTGTGQDDPFVRLAAQWLGVDKVRSNACCCQCH
jgi:DNA polymerase family A